MKKIAVFIFIIMLGLPMVKAQDYQTALGVRGGFFSGISIKHFISRTDAVEGIAAFHHRGFMLAGMLQRHANAFDAPGLSWYYGGGAHAGFYDRQYTPWFGKDERGNVSTFGVMGALGLEYKIEEIPVTIGADLTPAFNIFGHTGVWMGSGLTLRYTFQ